MSDQRCCRLLSAGAKVSQPVPRVFLFDSGIWTEPLTDENVEQEEDEAEEVKEEEKEELGADKEEKEDQKEEEESSALQGEADAKRTANTALPSAKRKRTDD